MFGLITFTGRVAGMCTVAAALLLGATSTAATTDPQADAGIDADDQACLDCHGSAQNAAKHAVDGRKAQVIDVAAYLRSVHGDLGCGGCHPKIKLPAHPDKLAPTPAADVQRKLPGAVVQVCRSCHARVVKAFDGSVHAQALRDHKKSAPDCNDCHAPHAISTASVQDGPKNVCLACHDDPAKTHRSWLPDAELHLQAVACDACHAPAALPRVDLRLAAAPGAAGGDLAALFEPLAAQADSNHDGLDAHEFQALLEAFERQGSKLTVRGHIELRSGVKSHMLPDKSRALKDCFSCHDQDAAPYKRVTVSVLDAYGGPVRYDAHREILTAAISMEALKGFYALGGTRLAQLDWLLALGLGFGLSVPGLHFAARRLLARRAEATEPPP